MGSSLATSSARAGAVRTRLEPYPAHGALAFNFLSGLAFLAGALLAYGASLRFDVTWLVPVATGNFIDVAASDLVPEVNKPQTLWSAAVHLLAFTLGLGLVFGLHGH